MLSSRQDWHLRNWTHSFQESLESILIIVLSFFAYKKQNKCALALGAPRDNVLINMPSVGAAVKSVGTAVKHNTYSCDWNTGSCNKCKMSDLGLQIGSWDYEGNNVDEYLIVIKT